LQAASPNGALVYPTALGAAPRQPPAEAEVKRRPTSGCPNCTSDGRSPTRVAGRACGPTGAAGCGAGGGAGLALAGALTKASSREWWPATTILRVRESPSSDPRSHILLKLNWPGEIRRPSGLIRPYHDTPTIGSLSCAEAAALAARCRRCRRHRAPAFRALAAERRNNQLFGYQQRPLDGASWICFPLDRLLRTI
jgi:hypothetical protein